MNTALNGRTALKCKELQWSTTVASLLIYYKLFCDAINFKHAKGLKEFN